MKNIILKQKLAQELIISSCLVLLLSLAGQLSALSPSPFSASSLSDAMAKVLSEMAYSARSAGAGPNTVTIKNFVDTYGADNCRQLDQIVYFQAILNGDITAATPALDVEQIKIARIGNAIALSGEDFKSLNPTTLKLMKSRGTNIAYVNELSYGSPSTRYMPANLRGKLVTIYDAMNADPDFAGQIKVMNRWVAANAKEMAAIDKAGAMQSLLDAAALTDDTGIAPENESGEPSVPEEPFI